MAGSLRRPSSVSLPRVGAGPRLLRVKADDHLLPMLRIPPADSGGGAFVVPSREPVVPGDRIDVEVSFGAMADEVICSGVVQRITPRGWGEAPEVHIDIARTHAHRVRYINDAVRGLRRPTARRHRRYVAKLDARWFYGIRPQPFQVEELSMGGTFVASMAKPRPGFEFDMELRADSRSRPLRVRSRVVWLSEERGRTGFGAEFRLPHREAAERLSDIVRKCERNGQSAGY